MTADEIGNSMLQQFGFIVIWSDSPMRPGTVLCAESAVPHTDYGKLSGSVVITGPSTLAEYNKLRISVGDRTYRREMFPCKPYFHRAVAE